MSHNLSDLGGVVEAEADLLRFLGLGGGSSARISRSSVGTVLASVTMLAIWMESSVASARVRLSVSQA